MSHSNTVAKTQSKISTAEGTVEVLYQKMGDRWFAFSLVGEDVFVGSLTDEEISGTPDAKAAIAASDRLHRVTGNS
jgi:hypothetical protein